MTFLIKTTGLRFFICLKCSNSALHLWGILTIDEANTKGYIVNTLSVTYLQNRKAKSNNKKRLRKGACDGNS